MKDERGVYFFLGVFLMSMTFKPAKLSALAYRQYQGQ